MKISITASYDYHYKGTKMLAGQTDRQEDG